MKQVLSAFIYLLFLSSVGFSQNIGIGTNTPHPSAALEIADSSKGILIPRMSMSQRLAIQNPAEGLMVYQTDTSKGFWYWDGLEWTLINNKISTDTLSNQRNNGTKIFDMPGSYNWVVPSGVKKVMVELWGGGGGNGGQGGGYRIYTTGGWVPANGGAGGKGGKGGYNKIFQNVTPGQLISVKVGSGGLTGSGGSGGENNNPGTQGNTGDSGGESSFNNITANGGFGGVGGNSAYKCCYQCACNGTVGADGLDGEVKNYDYPYNSFQQIRSYLPVNYVPAYPTPRSNPGENGIVIVYMGN